MAMSKALGMYADCRTAFDAVVLHRGGTFTFDSKSAALAFRQRAYYFRKLLHEEQSGNRVVHTSTPYDAIVIRMDPDDGRKLRITNEVLRATFVADDGTVVAFEDVSPAPAPLAPLDLDRAETAPEDDGLMDEALAFINKLTKGK